MLPKFRMKDGRWIEFEPIDWFSRVTFMLVGVCMLTTALLYAIAAKRGDAPIVHNKADYPSSFNTTLAVTFALPKSGTFKPIDISIDYNQAVCDIGRIMYGSMNGKSLSKLAFRSFIVTCDDGGINFDCDGPAIAEDQP